MRLFVHSQGCRSVGLAESRFPVQPPGVESVPRGLEWASNVQQHHLLCPGGDDHFGRLREMGVGRIHQWRQVVPVSLAGRVEGVHIVSKELLPIDVLYGEAYSRDAVCATTPRWWP